MCYNIVTLPDFLSINCVLPKYLTNMNTTNRNYIVAIVVSMLLIYWLRNRSDNDQKINDFEDISILPAIACIKTCLLQHKTPVDPFQKPSLPDSSSSQLEVGS